MQVDISWQGGVQFVASNASGHQVLMDGPPESGGRDTGSRPMELMLMGLGGCTSFDVIQILEKARQQVTDCHAELSAERAEDDGHGKLHATRRRSRDTQEKKAAFGSLECGTPSKSVFDRLSPPPPFASLLPNPTRIHILRNPGGHAPCRGVRHSRAR